MIMKKARQEFLDIQVETICNKFIDAIKKTSDHAEVAYLMASTLSYMIAGHKAAMHTMLPESMIDEAMMKTMDNLLEPYGLQTIKKIIVN
jgi:hypothetical protein